MIVKNESKIIKRCIDAALPIISGICISDTGSTDNTMELIQSYQDRIPTKVVQEPFVDFEVNRTKSFNESRAFANSLEWDIHSTYALFLDADMILMVDSKFDAQTLIHAGYKIEQGSPTYRYVNVRLARLDYPWVCIGETHECWQGVPNELVPDLFTLSIDDRGDGGCKADKFERDERLLLKSLSKNPKNARSMFYLGNTYRCLASIARHESCVAKDPIQVEKKRMEMEDYESKALKMYKLHLLTGSFTDEEYMSLNYMGEIYQDQNRMSKANDTYLKAYEKNPYRAETLTKIAINMAKEGRHLSAYDYADKAMKIPLPRTALFLEPPYFREEPLCIKTLTCYYLGRRNEGLIASEQLLLRRNFNKRDMVHNNLIFYVDALPRTSAFRLPSQARFDNYTAMNPCFFAPYMLNLRHVNYSINSQGHYVYNDGGHQILTRNFLLRLDATNRIIKRTEIMDDFNLYPGDIKGMEDLRPFYWDDELWALATAFRSTDQPESRAVPRIHLLKLDDGKIIKRMPLNYSPSTTCEKNWLPIVKEGKLYVIYSHEPFTLLEVSKEGEVTELIKRELPACTSYLRGSGAPVKIENGYLGLTHEVCFNDNKRKYLHRFVWYNEELIPVKQTVPFCFFNVDIEYSNGFTLVGSDIHIGVGVRDGEAFGLITNLDLLNRLATSDLTVEYGKYIDDPEEHRRINLAR